jgi:two-component system sensor histidine kinase HupT/HoxJ
VEDSQAQQQIASLLAAGRSDVQDVEIALPRQQGEPVPVTWNVSPLYDGEGRYSGFVAVGGRWANSSAPMPSCRRRIRR